HHPVVLIHVRLDGKEDLLPRLKVYALMSPHADGGGAGNSARVAEVAGKRVLLACKDGTSIAMAADCGFSAASCGYVGASDGWQDLKRNCKMGWEFGTALNGNVAVMGEIEPASTSEFTVAIGFGEGHHSALSSTMGALAAPFEQHLKRFIEQWHRATTGGCCRSATTSFWHMRTRALPAHSLLRLRFRGGMPRATMIWADTTWCGPAIWCRARRRCWLAGAWKRRGARWCIWRARRSRMAGSRRISG